MLEFTPGVTIATLNGIEQRLGNDYIDNLLEIGIVLLPELYKHKPSYKVVRAFTPKARLERGVEVNWFHRKFTRGLAITVTWDDWNTEDAIALGRGLLTDYKRKCHYIVNTDDKTFTVLIKMRDKSMTEVIDGKKRDLY